jgi:sialate O-acetylesterase
MKQVRLAAASLVLLLASHALAEIKLPPLFADHMVLQRGMAVPVWGTVGANQEVTIDVAGKTAKATADAQGNFIAKLPPLEYGGNAVTMTLEAGGEKLVLKDVLIGDVWLGSGQSNMEWTVRAASKNAEDLETTAKGADHPNIRLFTFPKTTLLEPTRNVRGEWKVCTPENVVSFSAVAYHFARNVHEMEKVPVGMITNAWGGRPVEAFISEETLKSDPAFKSLLDRKQQAGEKLPEAKVAYEKKLAEWEKLRAAPNPTTKPGNKPQEPMGAQESNLASNIYNGMVHPVVPFAIKGVIWYQGESNAGRAEQYRTLFPALIADWRKQWGQGDFPFIWVQLANYNNRKPPATEPGDSEWAELREAQSMTLKVPNTAQAVIIDIGEANDIHPKNKHDVGKRLALAAERIAYGKNDVVHSGPVFDSMKIEGGAIRLKFRHADGLHAKDGSTVKGFAIAGEDRKFVWADAKVEGDAVVVSAKGVEKPVAVRYAWADNPECNLYNGAGLPASPFRTDDFAMITAGKQ